MRERRELWGIGVDRTPIERENPTNFPSYFSSPCGRRRVRGWELGILREGRERPTRLILAASISIQAPPSFRNAQGTERAVA